MRKGIKIAGLTAVGLGAVYLVWHAGKAIVRNIDFSRFFREDEPYVPDLKKKSEDAPAVNIVEVDYDDIYNRVLEESNGNERLAKTIADQIVENWVPELSQNIQEWVEHKPFTDIKIGVMTMDVVINMWGGQRTATNMARAMKEFRDYIDRGYTHPEIFEKWFVYG